MRVFLFVSLAVYILIYFVFQPNLCHALGEVNSNWRDANKFGSIAICPPKILQLVVISGALLFVFFGKLIFPEKYLKSAHNLVTALIVFLVFIFFYFGSNAMFYHAL